MEYIINNVVHDYKTITPTGENVLLKKLVNKLDKKYGDIYLPQEVMKNCSFGIAQVIALGPADPIKDSGLKVNDYVLYDYYSVYNDNPEYVLTKIENIILQLTPEEAEDLSKTRVIYQ